MRLSPRRDCDAAPLLRFNVAHCLAQLPAVATNVLNHHERSPYSWVVGS
jgi:hypothetical protein